MGRSYQDELVGLAAAYRSALSLPESNIAALRADLTGGPAVFVGAGGALACAKLAAELHERYCGSMARAVTPLEVAIQPPPDYVTVVLISARARHLDTPAAATAVLRAGTRKLLLLTQRPREELTGVLADSAVSYHYVPNSNGYDGFLATGSLLATAVLLVRAYAPKSALPDQLPSLGIEEPPELRRRLLVMSAPGAAAPASDLEARFSETGLADIELTDYRNFGHGRHYGFMRRLNETTIIALSTPESLSIAERTMKVLPDEAHIIHLHSSLPWPSSALDLLVRTAQLLQPSASRAKVDPAKPSVPAFGRRLYHLPMGTLLPMHYGTVQRKLAEAIKEGPSDDLFRFYERALDTWLQRITEVTFSGLILDYDGTVCATCERFSIPRTQVRAQIERLLTAGTTIGFATGRGSSLYNELRQWVSPSLWSQVYLGLYNCALTLTLADNFPDVAGEPTEALQEAYDRLQAAGFDGILRMKLRTHQLSIESASSANISLQSLRDIVTSVLRRRPDLPLTVLTSGHSIDVVGLGVNKSILYEELTSLLGGDHLLAIGDQGQRDGNDHALLAYSEYTLSVDRCSADPSRCWNLNRSFERGPDALIRYLTRVRIPRKGRFRFAWSGT